MKQTTFTLRTALLLGLLTATGENVTRLVEKFVLRQPLQYGSEMVWMTPAADAAFFIVLGFVTLLLARGVPSLRRREVLLGVLVFPVWLTAAMFISRIHFWAQLILATGLAFQTARLLQPRLERVDRLVARGLPVLLGLTLITMVSVESFSVLREWRAERALPEARGDSPNVLLLIWDTARASSLSLYGYPRPTTPRLTRFASTGVAFDRAMSAASWTLPSHASIFTGRWADELSTNWKTPLDNRWPTLAEVLSRAGYRTGAFAANRFFVTREFGLARGFVHFDEERLSLQEILRCSTLIRTLIGSESVRRLTGFADFVGRQGAGYGHHALAEWLAHSPKRPYFAFVNFMDTHAPYLPSAPYDTAFGWYSASTPAAERRRLRLMAHLEYPDLSFADAKRLEAAYNGAIAQLDQATGELLDDLEGRGLLRNTLVVIAADHGEEFGGHGQFGHGNDLYLQSLHVPLVISFPGQVPKGVRVRATVSLRDLSATILDFAGLSGALPGRSLRRFWTDSGGTAGEIALASVRFGPGIIASAPLAKGDMLSVITDSLQLIRDGTGTDSVFDLNADPRGTRPANPSAEALARLRAALPQRPR